MRFVRVPFILTGVALGVLTAVTMTTAAPSEVLLRTAGALSVTPAPSQHAAPTPDPAPSPTPGAGAGAGRADADIISPRPPTPPRTTGAAPGEGPQDAGGSAGKGEPPVSTDALEPGDTGAEVSALQRRLDALGYWPGEVDGSYGELTRQAVLAFQGVAGLPRDGVATPEVRTALADAGRPRPQTDQDDVLEVNLHEQVLRVVRDGRVAFALHVSTGTGEPYQHPSGGTNIADTPAGTWTISWRVDGWRESDLGRLYRPAYFHERGIAIHGYPEVPPEPASHGCVRVTLEAMDLLWDRGLVEDGQTVIVH